MTTDFIILRFSGAYELVYYVHGRKLHFNISNHDGRHVDRSTSKSTVFTTDKYVDNIYVILPDYISLFCIMTKS